MAYAECTIAPEVTWYWDDHVYFLYLIPTAVVGAGDFLSAEALDHSCIYKSIIVDGEQSSPIATDQVSIRDVDEGLYGNTGPDVVIHFHGPSSDPSEMALGFDSEGAFGRYYRIAGRLKWMYPKNYHEAPQHLALIRSTDWGGFFFYHTDYLFDSTTKAISPITDHRRQIEPFATAVQDSIPFYDTSAAATSGLPSQKHLAAGTEIIVVGMEFDPSKRYAWPLALRFTTANGNTGWLNAADIHDRLVLLKAD